MRLSAERSRILLAALLGVSLPGAYAQAAASADGLSPLGAKAYLVLHNKTGKVLAAHNANEVYSIASLTKLQAALVVRARGIALKKDTEITRADHLVAVRGSRSRLELKWRYGNKDLLHAALMSSDNRATSALGRAVKLDARGLVAAMNELAQRMGLSKTVFHGPVGIDHGNKSSCWDMARIVRRAAKDPVLSEIMGKATYMVKPRKGYIKVHYRNTNTMVGKKKGRIKFLATKTGFNDKARYCLAVVAKLRGIGEVTYVILGSKSKYGRVLDQRRVVNWLLKKGPLKANALVSH